MPALDAITAMDAVIPAKAVIQLPGETTKANGWIPAFAGMTARGRARADRRSELTKHKTKG